MSSHRRKLYVLAVVGVGVLVPAMLFLTSAGSNSSVYKNEFPVRRGSINQRLAARGRVEGMTSQEIKLASRVVGRLKQVSVVDGDPVRKGQIVAVLENNDLAAQVEQARANLAHAEAVLEKLMNGARPEERDASRAQVEQAQADADNAQQNYERAKNLFQEGGIISRSTLEQAERDSKMSQARLGSARANYKLIMAPPRSEDVAAAQAEVGLARAQLAQVEDNYNNTFVRAPVDGVVVKRYMNPGEAISYESLYQPIVSVSDITRLMVRAEVDETDIGKIAVGQRSEVRCEAFPGQTFCGRVVRISGGLGKKQIQTDNPLEKVDTDVLETFVEMDPGSPLRVGLRVDVYVQLARKDNVLIVPLRALEKTDSLPVVHVKSSSGVRVQRIGRGAQDGLNVEVTGGLKEGDVVVY